MFHNQGINGVHEVLSKYYTTVLPVPISKENCHSTFPLSGQTTDDGSDNNKNIYHYHHHHRPSIIICSPALMVQTYLCNVNYVIVSAIGSLIVIMTTSAAI
jgi:hypothetical protein